MSRHTRAAGLLATAGTLGTVLALAAPPASAEPAWRVVASGLNSPRSLTVSADGDIYVAESGKGGKGPCAQHPALGKGCLGFTGAITRVDPDGADERVVTRLPSLAGPTEAIGPMDVFVGRHDCRREHRAGSLRQGPSGLRGGREEPRDAGEGSPRHGQASCLCRPRRP